MISLHEFGKTDRLCFWREVAIVEQRQDTTHDVAVSQTQAIHEIEGQTEAHTFP